MKYYNPFKNSFAELKPSDLKELYSVSEGWYVEYKSQQISVKKLGKSISSFANQYGGWLIIGVEEDQKTLAAKSFPGIDIAEIECVYQNLRNASKDVVNPEVYYETKEFRGPIKEIGLNRDRAILIIRIPPGPEPAYIHSDGRIYRRVADSSDPKPETDRALLERLWDRAKLAKTNLRKLINRRPVLSEGESNNCYLNLIILSDPYEIKGHWFSGKFTDFVNIMKDNPIPCNNIFTRSLGFVARQTAGNDPYNRVFTWEFDRHCHSFVSLPINVFSKPYIESLDGYTLKYEYVKALDDAMISSSPLLDLNMIFEGLASIFARHRTLVGKAKIYGPFYVKVQLENTWRAVPFLNMPSFLQHIKKYGFPVVQEEDIIVYPGEDLDNFVLLPERNLKKDVYINDAINVSMEIFEALGIPIDFFISTGDHSVIEELIATAEHFRNAQQLRNTKKLIK